MKTQDINTIYNKLIRAAYFSTKMKNWESALEQIEIAAHIMYKYSFFFCDAQADHMLRTIGREVIRKASPKRTEKAVLFYDSFGQDRRGLAQIYMRALCKAGYRIIYLVCNKNAKCYQKTAGIVQDSGGCVVPVLMDNRVQRMRRIEELVTLYAPECIFMEVLPWDTAVLAAFSAFKGVIPRFYINITDHLFWVGRYSFDTCIEFRAFGYGLSETERRIPEKHLACLPYYPLCENADAMPQLDKRIQNRRYVYSGGTLDKLKGSDKFWKICESILDHHPDVCILYTGNGDSDPIKKFIADHHYESRFIYEHERQDFEQLLSHCVFFLNTYPAAGGLMAQYAVAHGRLPVTFTDSVTDTTDLFLDREKAGIFVFTDVESVCRYTDRLLDDDAFLKEEESYLEDLIISEEDFSGQLRSIMRNKPGRIRFSYSPEEIRDTAEQGKLAYQLSESELHKLLFASDKTRLLFPVRYIRYLIEQSQQKE